jgi:hypothetical protein
MIPQRIQLQRTKGWRMPPNTVKVDRTTRWGNPYKVRPAETAGGVTIPAIETVAQAVELYRGHLEACLKMNPDYLAPLRGKNLACWCRIGDPCHGDVLIACVLAT